MISLQFQYKPLIQLKIDHEYYSERSCREMEFVPLNSTSTNLQRFEILFRRDDDGILLLCDQERRDSLIQLLKNSSQISFDFWMLSKSPYFQQITELPLMEMDQVLYLTNHDKGLNGQFMMHQSDLVDTSCIQPIRPSSFTYPLDANVKNVEVCNGIGEVIKEFKVNQTTKSVDIYGLNEGFYALKLDGKEDHSFVVMESWGKKYPVALLSLQLTESMKEQLLEHLESGEDIPEFKMNASFAARNTYWRYKLVSKYVKGLDNVSITSEDGKAKFTGPEQVTLLNGQNALQFQSTDPLKLKEFSPHYFQLNKKGNGGSSASKVLIKRLPVPAIDSMRPDRKDEKIYSEILIFI